jgi:hypothetical protein
VAKSFLDFGFQTMQDQRKRYGNTATFDKLSNFLSQEILVINILMAEENREKLYEYAISCWVVLLAILSGKTRLLS